MVVYPTTMGGETPILAYIAGHLSHPSHPSLALPANPQRFPRSATFYDPTPKVKKNRRPRNHGDFQVPSSGFIDSAWISLGDFP